MTSYYTDPASARQLDGANAVWRYDDIPLALMREVSSNDIPAGGTAAAMGGVLSKDSTPNLEFTNGDTDSALRLQWAASNSDPIVFQKSLPENLDASGTIYVKFLALMGGTTDSFALASDTYFGLGDTKVEDVSGTVSGTVGAVYTIAIAAADVPAGAATMTCELTPGAHTTDTFEMYACWVKTPTIP